jgi:hypothetical protein
MRPSRKPPKSAYPYAPIVIGYFTGKNTLQGDPKRKS